MTINLFTIHIDKASYPNRANLIQHFMMTIPLEYRYLAMALAEVHQFQKWWLLYTEKNFQDTGG